MKIFHTYYETWQQFSVSNDDLFFCNSKWLKHWIDTFWDNNCSLYLFTAYDANNCVLFAPFYIKQSKTFPYIKTLSLLGQGEDEVCEVSSEYQDIFVHPEYENL